MECAKKSAMRVEKTFWAHKHMELKWTHINPPIFRWFSFSETSIFVGDFPANNVCFDCLFGPPPIWAATIGWIQAGNQQWTTMDKYMMNVASEIINHASGFHGLHYWRPLTKNSFFRVHWTSLNYRNHVKTPMIQIVHWMEGRRGFPLKAWKNMPGW